MPKKTIFNMVAAAMLNIRKLLFGHVTFCLHTILHPLSKFCTNLPKWC